MQIYNLTPSKMNKEILEHIKKQKGNLPSSAITLALYCHISEILCFHRVKIETSGFKTYPNLYGVTFMKSAGGKDEAQRLINEVTGFREYTKRISDDIYSKQKKLLETQADNKIKDGDMKQHQKEKYLSDNEPRYLVTRSNDGTVEGMMAMREALEDSKIGHCNFVHSEFSNYIIDKNSSSETILRYLLDAYSGSTEGKVIKGNKRVRAVEDVPQTMLVHSSIKGLIKDNQGSSSLKRFLDDGLGRRCFCCFPDKKDFGTFVDISDNFLEINKQRKEDTRILKEKFAKLYKKIELDFEQYKFPEAKIITIEHEAEMLYHKYEAQCQNYNGISSLPEEKSSRHWKMIKLAAVIAFLDDKMVISKEHIQGAITFTDGWSSHTENLYSKLEGNIVKDVYEFIIENPDCTATKIRTKCIPNKDSKILENTLQLLEEYCHCHNMNLSIRIEKNRFKYYTIKTQEEQEILQKKEKVDNELGEGSYDLIQQLHAEELENYELKEKIKSLELSINKN